MSRLRDRLFFYSSRQLYRRRKSYLSIFIVSVVLLTLVMTFLETIESYFLRDIEIDRHGTHHAFFLEQMYDYSDDIVRNSRVESAFAVPFTSWLASSDDASAPGKLTVATPEICDFLHVRYLWGHEPGDGEIAVPVELYNAYSYLTAGEENELFFKASEMTYFPLKLCGIFETNNMLAQNVLVNQKTADAIDRETGAAKKYDNYFRCKSSSNRYIGLAVHELFRDLKIQDSDVQKRQDPLLTAVDPQAKSSIDGKSYNERVKISGAWNFYKEYINESYIEDLERQSAAPLVLISLPVIIIAALLLASFMSNWMMTNSPEYGVLAAIGANRRNICAISAGQILLIAGVSAVPVSLLSALVSNIYISAFNEASSVDTDFVFTIPWGHILESALWYVLLSCLFTYITTDRLTRQTPFVLISGSYRGEIPFVKRTNEKLGKAKDKIRQMSILTAMRNLKSEIVPSVVTALICLVCGAFLLVLLFYRSTASSILETLKNYQSDTVITVKDDSNDYVLKQGHYEKVYGNRKVYLSDEEIRLLRATEGVKSVAAFRSFYYLLPDRISDDLLFYPNVCIRDGSSIYDSAANGFMCDQEALSSVIQFTLEGDPADLFRRENQVIRLIPAHASDNTIHAGDKLTLVGGYYRNSKSNSTYYADAEGEFTVCAVCVPNVESEDFHLLSRGLLLSKEGSAKLELCDGDEYDTLLVNYDLSLSNVVLQSTIEKIRNDPAFLRFDFTNHTIQTDSEKRIEAATTWMLVFFFGMLYLAFCTMTYVNSTMKVRRETREFSVLRQLGADSPAIYKTMRVQTYPGMILSSLLTCLLLIFAVGYLLISMSNLSATADFNDFPPSTVAVWREKIFSAFIPMILIWLASLPVQAISYGVTILGTVLPTRRLLKTSIVEGIRKDTD